MNLNNPDSPLTVSVIMCTYNGSKFLHEQIDSILTQTYPIYEFIIQDDCSTDSTWDILQQYASQHPFIKIFRNKTNKGFNHNFQTAISRAQGQFIAIADQDDIWYPNKISKQIDFIGNHDICISYYHNDKIYVENKLKKLNKPSFNLEYLTFYDSTPGHSMLLRTTFAKSCFEKWDGHIIYDWWLSINAHLYNGIVCVPESLNWHRPHQGSAIEKLTQNYAPDTTRHTAWKPYIIGYKKYKELQQLPTWQFFYTYLYKNTGPDKFSLVHQICGLLLKNDLFSLIRLCYLCMHHKDLIYFTPGQKGLMGHIRSFCYPMIRSYGNTYFYL